MIRPRARTTRLLALTVLVASRLAAVAKADCLTAPTAGNVLSISSPVAVAGGTYAIYTCQVGYEFWSVGSSSYNRSCSGGTWETISNCQPVHCPALPSSASTVLSTTSSTFGTVVVASCQAGYQIDGLPPGAQLSVACLSNKEWNSTIGSALCVSVRCNHPAIANATWDNASYAAVSTTTVYTCLTGYFFPGNVTTYAFQCSSVGTWTPGNVFCNPVRCPALAIPNGAVDNPNATVYPSVVYASCMKGYHFDDGSVAPALTCSSDGAWTPTISQCLPVTCQAPPSAAFATHNVNVSATYGNSVNYSCVDGYLFADGTAWRLSTCNEFSLWSPPIPPCMPADQLPQPDIKHVAVKVEAPDALGQSSLPIGLTGAVLAIIFILDVITFPIQIAYVKKSFKAFMDRMKPPEPEPEPVELRFPSVISLGRGRVTPAPSITDLGFVREDERGFGGGEPTSPFGDKDPLVRAFFGGVHNGSVPDIGAVRTVAPTNPTESATKGAGAVASVAAKKDRLKSAKRSVQQAIEMTMLANNLSGLTRARRNEFVPNILPLHADNVVTTRGSITVAINNGYDDDAESQVDDDTDDSDDDDDSDDGSDNAEGPARNDAMIVPGQVTRDP